MNRPFERTFLISGLLMVLSGFSALAAGPDESFFPLKPGLTWVYKTTHKTKKKVFDMTVKVEGPWKDGGEEGTILTQHDTRGQMRQFLLKTEKGFFLTKLGLSKSFTPEVFTRFKPAMPCVIFPLQPGTKMHWEGRLKVLTDKPIVFDGEVVGWEDLDVPAGHFHCIKLHYHEKRGTDVIDENAWYAENVGQVKYDGGEYIKELKSYQ